MKESKDKRWVGELHKELQQIMRETKLSLPRPAILLHESEQVWGHWDPLNLTISLSRPLVESCGWRVVVEILKHEIAHQITDYQYGHDVSPHGTEFGSVCKLLRVEDWARSAASGKSLRELQALANWKLEPEDQVTLRYRRRLEKLLALADSTNEHEALLAMRRAQELQDQHRLGRPKRETEQCIVSLEIGSRRQRHATYEGRIASILMSHFHVDIVFATRFDAALCRPEAIIDIMGRREDVLLAEYVHGFLHQSALRLWQDKRQNSRSQGLRARNSYIRGLLAGFDKKLTEQAIQVEDSDERVGRDRVAMVRADEQARARYQSNRYPRLTARRSSVRIDRGAYRAGQSEGGKLNLRPPVSAGGARSPTSLLPS